MTFDRYLETAKMQGKVKDLMTKGLAVEFIQPWYTPLSTTPATTGIAVGGIGSTYTVTPAGTTPVTSLIPGVQVRVEKADQMRLQNMFYSEAIVTNKGTLQIRDFFEFARKLQFYPLKAKDGSPLFAETNEKSALAKIERIIADKTFFETNKDALNRWHTDFSSKTQAMIANGKTTSQEFNRSVLIDFFDGILGEKAEAKGSLTAAFENDSEFLGQKGYDALKMDYAAEYPVSRTKYTGGKGVQITRYQYSYVLPNNERISSLPVSATRYVLSNPTKDIREITLVQMQDNYCGYEICKDRQGIQDSSFVLTPTAHFPKGVEFTENLADGRSVKGIEFYNERPLPESDFDGCMGISATWNPKDDVTVTTKPLFYQDDEKAVLEGALQSGRVSKTFVKNVYSGRETVAGALVATIRLKPKAKATVQFNTVLDFAHIRLNGMESLKKYTVFYPESFGRVKAMLSEALSFDSEFEATFGETYRALAPETSLARLYPKDKKMQGEFRSLALNTLSFIAEATVWDKDDRFLVRECADYPFFNSLDVYFYGSFSLLSMLPRLDGEVMRRFADAILAEDPKTRRHHEYVNNPFADLPEAKLEGPRAVCGAVIHDLGSPFDAKPDAYDWHNVKEWKDLAPKYVLMVLRHYKFTGDKSVVEYCKNAVYACMEYLEKMVGEGENFPLTHGTDDTFDNLSSNGISVYCGSLWIAGLRAAAKIAELTCDSERALDWNKKADEAESEFHSALWDEQEGYFHFFATPIESKDIDFSHFDELMAKVSDTIPLSGSDTQKLRELNDWLNSGVIPTDVGLSKLELRHFKKEWLYSCAPTAFKDSFKAKLTLDSDDVFADSMLADTYLRLLDLTPIADKEKGSRTLDRIFRTNYKANTPLLGAANLVHKDGSPLDEFNFQAHDVWIGIQYSLASGMILHGQFDEAKDLVNSMIKNLYEEAKVPFAAPEGFNGSCKLHPETLETKLKLSKNSAEALHKDLLKKFALLADSRISPKLPKNFANFKKTYGQIASKAHIAPEELFTLLHSTALKYTAGKYFRPGMVFAILDALKA
ncbi:MAG: GH116 family glycosyl hydrolase [Fibrobacteraceae bacterium]